jgi:hypothetical protein
LLLKEGEKFPFRTDEQFKNTESCWVVDLELWTGFKGSVSGCHSYCLDTKKKSVQWPTEADIRKKKGGRAATISEIVVIASPQRGSNALRRNTPHLAGTDISKKVDWM